MTSLVLSRNSLISDAYYKEDLQNLYIELSESKSLQGACSLVNESKMRDLTKNQIPEPLSLQARKLAAPLFI